MAGRRPLPTNLKVLKGTDRADRKNPNEPKPDIEIPDPPDFLSADAKDEWSRITLQLKRLGLITQLDRTELAMYCQAYGRMVKYERIIAETDQGELYTTKSGNTLTSPAMWVVNKSMEQCHKFLAEFGMTPASRSRIKVALPSGKQKNDFSEFNK